MEHYRETAILADEFKSVQKVLIALGDENRQHLILEMMQMGHCSGVRVGEITARTHLSRPAVSHHLQILKDAGIVKMRREGTRNYYYFDTAPESLNKLTVMLNHVKKIMTVEPFEFENSGVGPVGRPYGGSGACPKIRGLDMRVRGG